MTRVLTVFAVFIAVSPALAQTQSLADVAKAEEARRKAATKPASTPTKVYTNANLKADYPVAPPPTTSPAAPVADIIPGGNGSPSAAEPPAPPNAQDQAYWSARMGEARGQLDRLKMFAEALQSRINALQTDFVNRDDPAQKAVIDADRTKALAELERTKKDIDDATKKIAGIEDEARKAGVPVGWLR